VVSDAEVVYDVEGGRGVGVALSVVGAALLSTGVRKMGEAGVVAVVVVEGVVVVVCW